MTEGNISQKKLESYLWGAANLLRGVIDPSEYKSVIFPLMFFKRISDVYDEEYEKALTESKGDTEYASFPEQHEFQIPKGSHWKAIRQVTKDVGRAIKNAMENVEKANPDKLMGIFGDSNWTNKDRLNDSALINLIEHFSTINLSIKNVPQDEFGTAYEFLIKKFADDSGHTAAEFYTNRTVVRIMALILDPKPGESIYDPTCGSGGMLLNSALLVKEKGQEYRSLQLYGQEINLITSGIARMNMFIHGFDDFHIVRGDTLKHPAFVEMDKLKKFNIVIANPPYSISKWNQELWKHDPWGRNKYGVPPAGNADYAFFQHCIFSMDDKNGRCSILYPNGILERDAEKKMRTAIIEDDLIECVVGLGKDLFYNSTMESCLVFCRTNKERDKIGKILFIDAKELITRKKTQSFLEPEHIKQILDAYKGYKDVEGFAKVADLEEVRNNDYNLNLRLYVEDTRYINKKLLETPLKTYIKDWQESMKELEKSTKEMNTAIKEVVK
ncbi:MAG: class I SAM-dependent DNA methyltransferase [Actinomycetota bacterium]